MSAPASGGRPGRRLVVEADGGSRGNPGPAGYGALVRDALTGEVLAEVAESIGTATNNVAEYRGLIAGLGAAAAVDPSARVQVRMDSKLVVEQMSGRWKIKHPDLVPLALRARETAAGLGSVEYTWIPRERNAHADRLANEAMDAAARGEQWSRGTGGASRDTAAPPEEEDDTAEAPAWSSATTTPTVTLLLRHGETALSVDKRFAGTGDFPLTGNGAAQAEAAARALRGQGIDAIVTSPLSRCRATAAAVAAATGAPVRVEDGLRETDFGDWEGLTFAEVGERWPGELKAWLADPSAAPPNGESFTATARRVRTALDKIKVRHRHRKVLVVTHVTPIKLLVVSALGAPMRAMYRMQLDVASLTRIDWYDDGPATLRSFNDVHHL
ncbi:bifunctional RNase H/acid phosphatase [Actinomadura sp. NBRC 104425]|uniref:bifunctional RNase H/acid phosphatase n=1 Tax=Actinomadura sp. NBRC 104425 TaxID=3032204 RepID=UPI0024A2DE8B|nr:bifunctional RNase H/acid phosphatase [Actinomadura sp. NBRC 104425]GLZ13218.1 bifunctional RNase H/acid phosphatase [Actinomadura sp. NBRC 104425]